jgi:Uma2 family endonuclease
MPTSILQPDQLKRILRRRRACGSDRYDEVWNGVYVMSAIADNEHLKPAFDLASAVKQAMGEDDRVQVFAGTNVSDQPEKWRRNYRCPDVAIFLPGNPAQDRKSHWLGGPDFAVEVISPYDRSRKKFDFYAKVGVREFLLVDRKPWCLELYRRADLRWDMVGKSNLENPAQLSSTVVPVSFRLIPGTARPRIEVVAAAGSRVWLA